MAFATGRLMTRPQFSQAFTAEHVANLVIEVHRRRVLFHDGDAVVAPGISVHWSVDTRPVYRSCGSTRRRVETSHELYTSRSGAPRGPDDRDRWWDGH